MPTGHIKLWNADRKFGFITPDDSTSQAGDVFIHISALRAAGLEEPLPGGVFTYTVGEHDGRRVATDVEPLATGMP